MNFSWTKEADTVVYNGQIHSGFWGYKVVASVSDTTPIYPTNGYAQFLSNINNICTFVASNSNYNSNDTPVTKLIAGQKYNFSITYLLSEGCNIAIKGQSHTVPN